MLKVTWKKGQQVIYLPDHVRERYPTIAEALEDDECEQGFITSIKPEQRVAYVRYWSKTDPDELRTRANSEGTPLKNLWPWWVRRQSLIDKQLAEIERSQ